MTVRASGGSSREATRPRLSGVLAPVLTPFRPDLSPDPGRFARHCRWLLEQVPRDAAAGVREALTERELEVLQTLTQGLSTADIARELRLSINTIKTHLKSIYRKLAVTHRGEAVRRAKKLGLL